MKVSNEKGEVVDIDDPVLPPLPHAVAKNVIVARLIAAGKAQAAFTALKMDIPVANLTDDEFNRREQWNAETRIMSNDPDALALLTAIGADPAVILAP